MLNDKLNVLLASVWMSIPFTERLLKKLKALIENALDFYFWV